MLKLNKIKKLIDKNPTIRCNKLDGDYKLLDFDDNTLILNNLNNSIILTDKFGIGLASSISLDFNDIPDVIILNCKEG